MFPQDLQTKMLKKFYQVYAFSGNTNFMTLERSILYIKKVTQKVSILILLILHKISVMLKLDGVKSEAAKHTNDW